MIPRLQHLFDILEKDSRTLADQLGLVSPEQFQKSIATKWSISQIIAHLVTSERLMLQYMQKKILGISSIDESGLLEEIKMVLLKVSQRLPLRFRAPSVVVRAAPQYSSVVEALSDWQSHRTELYEFLKSITEDQIKKKFYRHPVTGYMNVQHALKFFHEHHIHHLPQIHRLLNS